MDLEGGEGLECYCLVFIDTAQLVANQAPTALRNPPSTAAQMMVRRCADGDAVFRGSYFAKNCDYASPHCVSER